MKEFVKPLFLSGSNIYEVNLRQYTPEGTIRAFMQHLPRLKNMGVEILWIMPVHPIGLINRKGSLGSYYSIKDFCGVNPEFGTKDDLQDLVNEIHNLDMRIILDWVANHAAWDNVWTKEHPEYFVRDKDGHFTAPYDWDDVIQIDHSSLLQQAEMIKAMSYWITAFNIDGFRADLAHLTPLNFWKNARRQLQEIKKDLIWLAETEELDYHDAFDISFTWKWMHKSEEVAKAKDKTESLRLLLNTYDNEFGDALRMYFTSNHDENSWNGTETEKYGIYAKAFAVFSFTYIHSVPLIYSGQELPNNKRLKFFDKDEIDWKDENVLHDFYKALLELRKNSKAIKSTDKDSFSFIENDHQLLAYQQIIDEAAVITILNLTTGHIKTGLAGNYKKGIYTDIFNLNKIQVSDTLPVLLDPGEYMVLKID